MTDNGHFDSAEFRAFAKAWNLDVVTSSPLYVRSNGVIECNVKTIRDPDEVKHTGTEYRLALLMWRLTLIRHSLDSPA